MFILCTHIYVCTLKCIHAMASDPLPTSELLESRKTVRKVTCLLHNVLEMFNFHFCLSLGYSSQKCVRVQINSCPVHTIILGSVIRKPSEGPRHLSHWPPNHPVHICSVRNSSGGLTFLSLEVPR